MAVEVEEVFVDGVFLIKVTSDKVNVAYNIQKRPSNPTMWFIGVDKGQIPERLQGRYTTPGKALNDLTKYLSNIKMTATKARDLKYEKSQAQKEARVASKSDDQNDL
jgi:hypothetical protein